MSGSAKYIIEDIYELFIVIHEQWPDKGGEAYARQMLEHDILLLGHYFGSVDPIGQYAEFNLLAECIVHLRMIGSAVKVDKKLDSWIDKIMEELKQKAIEHKLPVASGDAEEMVRQMKSIPLTEELSERGFITEDQKKALYTSFISLANVFVMRDGLVTEKESEAINSFERLLNEATSF